MIHFSPPAETFLNLLSDWLEILRGSSKTNGMRPCFKILNPYSILNGKERRWIYSGSAEEGSLPGKM